MQEDLTKAQKDDAQTISSVLAGNKDCYAELIRRYQNRLRSVLSFYCLSEHECEEYVQDAFVHAYENLGSFDRQRPFFPWLRTIALNTLRMEIRHKKTEERRAEEDLRSVQFSMIETDVDGIEAEQKMQGLRICLEKLGRKKADLLWITVGDVNRPPVLAWMGSKSRDTGRLSAARRT
jgi:RNA polymerase sigma factor (sigma-70 family)